MAAKFEIKASTGGQFLFNLKAGNGEVILTSERYKAKQDCENGIASVKKNSGDDKRYERKEAVNGESYFTLTAVNNQASARVKCTNRRLRAKKASRA
jgi:hypothetical protein